MGQFLLACVGQSVGVGRDPILIRPGRGSGVKGCGELVERAPCFHLSLVHPVAHEAEAVFQVDPGSREAPGHQPFHSGILQGIQNGKRFGAVLLLKLRPQPDLGVDGMGALVIRPATYGSQQLVRHVVGKARQVDGPAVRAAAVALADQLQAVPVRDDAADLLQSRLKTCRSHCWPGPGLR